MLFMLLSVVAGVIEFQKVCFDKWKPYLVKWVQIRIVSSTECDTLTALTVIYHVPDFLMLGCIFCLQIRDLLGIGNFVYYNVCVSLYSQKLHYSDVDCKLARFMFFNTILFLQAKQQNLACQV